MGLIQPPPLVLPLLAVTSRHEAAFAWASTQLVGEMGALQLVSPRFPFTQTDYYTSSMGDQLEKQFLAPRQLIDPERLSEFKCETNRWEAAYASAFDHDEPRPLNLDPGYLSQDKLVLASTKNHAHRIYLASGIFAEITLQYRSRRWQTCPWTYPDYAQSCYHLFFTECRDYLRAVLRPPETHE